MEEKEKMSWGNAVLHTQESAFTSKPIAAKKVVVASFFTSKAEGAFQMQFMQKEISLKVDTIQEEIQDKQ